MRAERTLAFINALVAVIMAAGTPLWPMYVAHRAHEEAIRQYGQDVDFGGMMGLAASLAALIFFAPSAVLWVAASLSMRRRSASRGLLQALAILSLIVPAILVVRLL
jgi:hypothetical protein